MLKLLTCTQGHYWEKPSDDGAPEVCPVCGRAADTMPLLDLAPSEDAAPESAAPSSPPPLCDMEGRPIVVGYEILHDLGKGPSGVYLYRARQVLVNRTVVLKVVYAKDDPGQLAWGALRGEAAALGRLAHPNIVRIFDAGERERQLFYNAVEHVDGPTLAETLSGKPWPIRRALAFVETLARAVQEAHQQNILHRNLKPASILLQKIKKRETKDEKETADVDFSSVVVKITDFGLSRRPVEGDAADVELQGKLPCYLSPEQAWGRAKDIGPATDVYALGAILYELLSGRPPFREATAAETLDAIQCREPPPARLPRDLAAVCRKCLAKQPRRRYASALALADDLRRCAEGRAIEARFAGNSERFGKWLRRHLRGIALILLGLGLGISLMMLMSGLKSSSSLTPPVEQSHRRNIARLESDLQGARGRASAADYLRYLLLAQREAEGDPKVRDPERARELLSHCPAELRHWEWHYLRDRVQETLDTVEFTAEMPILCLDVSRDGRYLAAGGGSEQANGLRVVNGEVSVWDLSKRERLRHWKLADPVRSLAFTANDGLAMVGSGTQAARNGSVQVRDLRTGAPRFAPRSFAEGKPTSVTVGSNSQTLLVMTDDARLHLLRADNGGELGQHEVWVHQRPPRGLMGRLMPMPGAIPDRLALISPEGSQLLLVPDARNPNPSIPFDGRSDTTYLSLSYDSGGDKLAAGALDKTISIWDVRFPQQPARILRGHKGAVTGVSFSRDGKRLASCSRDDTVRIWDVEQELELLALNGYGAASGVLFCPAPGEVLPGFAPNGIEPSSERLVIVHENKATVLLIDRKDGLGFDG